MTLASASFKGGCRRQANFCGRHRRRSGVRNPGKQTPQKAVLAVNQGVQLILNVMRCPGSGILDAINRCPQRGGDYAFNTPGAAPSGGCAAQRGCPTLLDEQDLLTVPTRSPTSFPTACTIFELLNDTLDIAYNTLTSKNRLLCLPVLVTTSLGRRKTIGGALDREPFSAASRCANVRRNRPWPNAGCWLLLANLSR